MNEPMARSPHRRRAFDEPGDAGPPSVLDLELQALAYEAALRYGARQVPQPLVEFLRPASG
jgi:hypothetical protein